MATVFLARLAGMGGFQRFVAIKRLHPHLSNETEFVEMFLDEARLAASIHHSHVVPILEVGTSPAGYYVVMEYIEGDTLAGLMARAAGTGGKLPAPIAMRIGLDTLSGLHAAHELRDEDNNLVNLVHRDVSPQNILVGSDGSARITDFGVAKASSRLTNTRSGTLKGKLAYMPPEQAKGGPIDQRTDVFAIGTVIWEALAGRRLFKGETELETLNRIMFEPIPSLREVDPEIPDEIERTILKALDRNLERRYSSAADFADALERAAQNGFPIATVRDTATYVQQVLGHEMQQQRAAVRAWLAAEPSHGVKPDDFDAIAATMRPSLSPPTVPPPRRTSAAPLSRPSAMLPLPAPLPPGSLPAPLPPGSLPAPLPPPRASWVAPPPRASLEQRDALPVMPAPPAASSHLDLGALASEGSDPRQPPPEGGRSDKSSLTSAAMSLPEQKASASAEQPASSARRGRPAALVPALAVLALGAIAFVGWSMRPDSQASVQGQSAPPPTAPVPTASASASAAATASAPPAPSATATAPATSSGLTTAIDSLPSDRPASAGKVVTSVPKKNDKGKPDAPATTATATTATATAAPTPAPTPAPQPPPADEGYKNPYR
jgi:serine/threonine-protein kinase